MGGGHRFFLLRKWLYVGLSVRGSGATGLRFCTAGAAGCSREVLTLIGSQEVFLFLKTFSQCKSTGSHSIEAEEVPLSRPGPGGAGMWWSQKHAHPGVRSIGAAGTCSDSVSTLHAAAAVQGQPARRRQARPCLLPAALLPAGPHLFLQPSLWPRAQLYFPPGNSFLGVNQPSLLLLAVGNSMDMPPTAAGASLRTTSGGATRTEYKMVSLQFCRVAPHSYLLMCV